ncbi:hypothetical protein PRUB_b0328 [Pseudoalteromonas rubra]|uniref:Uncharacterized protein n=1 Tax=Pseudoalteromonas rubra TaxID=43658 RepID=A0A8T0C0J0_9GAMM|nr:hypothetical protein [Pseudoalteromonas rubra]KAF7781184.1 hypothetical protein PRUB_b0328 [Pseudoalteromonas rubra]
MEFIFEPFVGLGALKFGMRKSEVKSACAGVPGIRNLQYQDGKLVAFSIDPSSVRQSLVFAGEDVLKLDRLKAALYFADQSNSYGQSQGGSLYFLDLGCALLQFESPSRTFLFFAAGYDTGEPLAEVSPDSIKSYYEDCHWEH